MEKVKEIKAELGGTERKLAEGLGHSREIGRLLGLVELDLDVKGGQLKETGEKLALTSASLEQTKADLMESMGESRKRKDEIEVLNGKLRSEKAECAALQARLESANSSLAQLQRDLSEARGTSKVRKDEIESLSMQLLREKGQVSSLKYEVDTRKKTTKDLESKLVALERRHWEAAGRAEDTKKDLERKHVDKVVENESLKKTVENLERKARNSDAATILKSKEVLEGVYKSLQRQFQAKEDDLMKVERERDEYRERLALYDSSFEPSSIDKTFGLRGKGKLDV